MPTPERVYNRFGSTVVGDNWELNHVFGHRNDLRIINIETTPDLKLKVFYEYLTTEEKS